MLHYAGMATIGEYLPISFGHSGCILLTCYAEKSVDAGRNVVEFRKLGPLDVHGGFLSGGGNGFPSISVHGITERPCLIYIMMHATNSVLHLIVCLRRLNRHS